MFLAAAGGAQIIYTLAINREEPHRGAVLGCHVGDGRAVHDRQGGGARTEKFHELADDFRLPQHLRHGQREVGRGDAFTQCAGQMNANHVRRQKINRLAEHARFGLDAANAPADDAQTVDHGRMRVGPDQSVRVIDGSAGLRPGVFYGATIPPGRRPGSESTPFAKYSRLT